MKTWCNFTGRSNHCQHTVTTVGPVISQMDQTCWLEAAGRNVQEICVSGWLRLHHIYVCVLCFFLTPHQTALSSQQSYSSNGKESIIRLPADLTEKLASLNFWKPSLKLKNLISCSLLNLKWTYKNTALRSTITVKKILSFVKLFLKENTISLDNL